MSTNGHVDDTYAEAFRSIFAEVLITARDRKWLDHAVHAATGHASSTIMCDCEAGVDHYVGPGGDESYKTPDGRPGVLVQFHVPRFRKDRAGLLEKALLQLDIDGIARGDPVDFDDIGTGNIDNRSCIDFGQVPFSAPTEGFEPSTNHLVTFRLDYPFTPTAGAAVYKKFKLDRITFDLTPNLPLGLE